MMTIKKKKKVKNREEKIKKSKQKNTEQKEKRKEQLAWGLTKYNSAHLSPVACFGSHRVEDVALD